MKCIIAHYKLLLALYVTIFLKQETSGNETYVLSFQEEIEGSFAAKTDTWIEFATPISSTKEFTVCHWLKIKFFGMNLAACTWAYCIIDLTNTTDEMECTQLCFAGDFPNDDEIFGKN